MESQLKNVLSRLGEGLILPVPYDTAIVALIPKHNNHLIPEFPECLEWLRLHQLSDGSWGTDRPTYAYGNVLCTLAAIIALKKWTNSDTKDDINRISRGERALQTLAKRIGEQSYESIGFEILFPMLSSEAKRFGLRVGVEFEAFEGLGCLTNGMFDKKYKSIVAHQQRYGWDRKHTFWFSLEMIAGLSEPFDRKLFAISDRLIETNGSVCGSPSATAFYLMTKRVDERVDAPIAYDYIRNLVDTNDGGVPPLSPSDTFELSFGLSALLMAGFPAKHPILKSSVDKLALKWNQFNGYVGCSSYLPPDIDAIAAFVYVFNTSGRFDSFDSLEKMSKFFNEKYFICFKGERNPSISVNINALIALKSYPITNRIQDIMSKVVDWLKSQISDISDISHISDKSIFSDKWHISPYYCISRAVFAFQSIDNQLAESCVDFLLRRQNPDFGWGLEGSTLEETALVTLAICFWFRTNSALVNDKNRKILESIAKFFNQFNGKRDVNLWIAKSLYCPILVVKMFIISAKYSLNKTITIFKCTLT